MVLFRVSVTIYTSARLMSILINHCR